MPHKFKFGFTGCPNNCLKAAENDIGIKGAVKPEWNRESCIFCGRCQAVCPQKIISVDREQKTLTQQVSDCIFCGKCIKNCPKNAWTGESGFLIYFGGLYGKRIALGNIRRCFHKNNLI